jgi:hypothetical protein
MKTKLARYVLDRSGEKKVILPVAPCERLLEDLHDLAVVAERLREAPIDVQEIKRRPKTKPLPTGRRLLPLTQLCRGVPLALRVLQRPPFDLAEEL